METGEVMDAIASLQHRMEAARDQGEYETALQLARESIELARQHLPVISLTQAYHGQLLSNYGMVGVQAGYYRDAVPILEDAVELICPDGDSDTPGCLNTRAGLALAQLRSGDIAAADTLLTDVVDRLRRLDPSSDSLATQLNNLASLRMEQGRYAESVRLYEEARAIDAAILPLGRDDPGYALDLANLADTRRRIGDFEVAADLLRESLGICERHLDPHHPQTGLALNNLAAVLLALGEYDEAEAYVDRALEVRKAVRPINRADLAQSLSVRAALDSVRGRFKDAERGYSEALCHDRQVFGDDHGEVATDWLAIAGVWLWLGRPSDAETGFRVALDIRQRKLGRDHPEISVVLQSLGTAVAARGGTTEAAELFRQAADIDARAMGLVFAGLSEWERRAYTELLQEHLSIHLSAIDREFRGEPGMLANGFEQVLQRKGIGAEALAVRRDALLSDRYPDLQPTYTQWRAVVEEICTRTFEGMGSGDEAMRDRDIAALTQEAKSLEGVLVKRIPEMDLRDRLGSLDRAAVASALRERYPDAALIEIVRIDPIDVRAVPARGERQHLPDEYLAYMLVAGDDEPSALVNLGAAGEIDRLVADLRLAIEGRPTEPAGAIRTGAPALDAVSMVRSAVAEGTRHFGSPRQPADDETVRRLGLALRRRVFDPLVSACRGRSRLLLSPDGELTRIPFEILPNDHGGYLFDDYTISYLSAARDVVKLRSGRMATASVVIAAPNYDLGGAPGSEAASGLFPPLPATDDEGRAVAEALGGTLVLGGEARKKLVISARSPGVLHLATHGFFRPREATPREDRPHRLDPTAASDLGRWAAIGRASNPLLRSGLALAGANTWMRGGDLPADAGNGILTAQDVTGIDLIDTDLVVLSACQTGLGDVLAGEGVIGLRRAFALAGAAVLVMSVWRVNDLATFKLMEAFYAGLRSGLPVLTALREAQTALRQTHPHPRDWGAFICQGDPDLTPRPR